MPHVGVLVNLAQAEGWSVRLVATPAAVGFIDVAELSEQCGADVRSDFRPSAAHGARSSHADALIIAPATYNTINKLALGINDNYALSVASEAIGRGTPVVVLPFVNSALAVRQPFSRAVESLRAEGVQVLMGPAVWQPHKPGTGEQHLTSYPWKAALIALASAADNGR